MVNSLLILVLAIIPLYSQSETSFEEYLYGLAEEFDIEQIEADSANLSKAILLDTREKEEFDVSQLKDAIWIGYNDFDMSLVDSLNRTEQIIVYCSVGYRSSKIGLKLKKAGFKNVKNLYGGIFKWANEGRPLYHDSNRTVRIHTYSRKWGQYLTNSKLIKMY